MKLIVAKGVPLPLEIVTQTIAILAKRRAGKSYTMRKFVEQLLTCVQQIVLVDPKGDQWGIRSSADGKHAGFPIVILGGEHGDAPLEPSAGEVVAKLVVHEHVSVLLDLSFFRKHEVATFMAAFLENIYRLKAQEAYRTPMMLVIDEADAIAPQKPQKGEERMLGAAEDIVRRGGQRGIGCALITQRSAVLNKNVLTQAQMLIVLRTIAPQDLAAMKAWIDVHGTVEQGKELMDSLPSLPTGDAWFWSPGWPTAEGIFKRAHVLPIETFDSGATPKPGEKPVVPKNLADVDLEALKKQMAATIEKAKQEDPKLLRKEIARLTAEVAKKQPAPVEHVVRTEIKKIEVPAIGKRSLARLEKAIAGVRVMVKKADDLRNATLVASDTILNAVSHLSEEMRKVQASVVSADKVVPRGGNPAPERQHAPLPVERTRFDSSSAHNEDRKISAPQQRILDALAWLEAAGRTSSQKPQLAALSEQSPRSSGYTKNLSFLRTAGLIAYPAPNAVSLTEQGRQISSTSTSSLTSRDIQDKVRTIISRPQWAIVEALIAIYPADISKEDLAPRASQSAISSGYTKNLSALRSAGFVDYTTPGCVRAADILFL